jgi:dihydrofolate reductase
MRKLTVFNSITLDGYFTGPNGDLRWAHQEDDKDPEFKAFTEQNAKGGGVVVMGRRTYDLMVSYWPTPEAKQNDPVVAERMNNLPKIVFARTMKKADWNNTTVVSGDLGAEVRKLKEAGGDDMVMFGSGSLIAQLSRERLIDEYQLVVVPVVLGDGRTMFEDMGEPLKLKLTNSRAFANGKVLLSYVPAK